MATRRSRLQVKPNIGGLKGPAKPAKKTVASVKDKEEVKSKVEEVKDKEKEVIDVQDGSKKEKERDKFDPQENLGEKKEEPKDAHVCVNDSKSMDLDTSVSDGTNQSGLKGKSTAESAHVIDSNEDAGELAADGATKDQTDCVKVDNESSEKGNSVLPRARLRKFGKVNLSAARGSVRDSVVKKGSKDENRSEEKSVDETGKAAECGSAKVVDTNEKVDIGESSKSTEPKVGSLMPRRARFPKAKPNVLEAGKRRQNIPSITVTPVPEPDVPSSNTDTGTAISQMSAAQPTQPATTAAATGSSGDEPSKAQSSLVSGQASGETTSQPSSATIDAGGHKVPHFPQSPLKAPVAPSVLASPLKQGSGAGEKRTRTVSVSEPVQRRCKKTKVDISFPSDQPPDRTTMRMRDMIYWSPSNNPMKAKIQEKGNGGEKENVVGDKPKHDAPAEGGADIGEDLPVPQVTIGPDGNIIVNEKSLVLDNPNKDLAHLSEIVDETDKYTTYTSFRKRCYSKKWSDKETTKFYKALAMLGTDFFMISKVFPNRSRMDLKKKFKVEDKRNRALIEKVLRERIAFDEKIFEAESPPVQVAEKPKKKEKPTPKPKEKKVTQKKMPKEKPQKPEKPKEKETAKSTKPQRKRVQMKNFNYYEDSWSEDEPEVVPNTDNSDPLWQPESVSQKDGEVIGILMDMSEGRLPTVGTAQQPVATETVLPVINSHSIDQSHSGSPDSQLYSDEYMNVRSPEILIARPLRGVRVNTDLDEANARFVEKVTAKVKMQTAPVKSKRPKRQKPALNSVPVPAGGESESQPMKLPLHIVLSQVDETGQVHSQEDVTGNLFSEPTAVSSDSPLSVPNLVGDSSRYSNSNHSSQSIVTSGNVQSSVSVDNPCLGQMPVISSSLTTASGSGQNYSQHSIDSLLGISSSSSSSSSTLVQLTPAVSGLETVSNRAKMQMERVRSQSPTFGPVSSSPHSVQWDRTSEQSTLSQPAAESSQSFLSIPTAQSESTDQGDMQLVPGQPQIVGVPTANGDMEQYVLVSMMPETGEETVIHVYRFHGGME